MPAKGAHHSMATIGRKRNSGVRIAQRHFRNTRSDRFRGPLRMNAQARLLEQIFVHCRIPYRVIGGKAFLTAEIKICARTLPACE